MDAHDFPDRYNPWPPGIEPAVPVPGYTNTWTHTPSTLAPAAGEPDRGDRSARTPAQAPLRRYQPRSVGTGPLRDRSR